MKYFGNGLSPCFFDRYFIKVISKKVLNLKEVEIMNKKKKIENIKYKSVGIIKREAVKENDLTYYITSYDMNELLEHEIEFKQRDYFGFDMFIDFVMAMIWSGILGFFIFGFIMLFFYFIAAAYGRYFEDILPYIFVPVFVSMVFTGIIFLKFYKKYRINKKMKKEARRKRKAMGYYGEFYVIKENAWQDFMDRLLEKDISI